MPASQNTTSNRRTILRFALQSVNIDDRPNAYKDPQLVLKPQLEVPPRRPYTGTRPRMPRMPVWRHFLMVHVKDKADELIKLDLAAFKQPSVLLDPLLQYSVACLSSELALVFRHPTNGPEKACATLKVVLQKESDLETVLGELDALNVSIEYDPAGHRSLVPGTTSRLRRGTDQASSPSYSFNTPRHLNSSSPLLAVVPGAQAQSAIYPEPFSPGIVPCRPPSQPVGRPASLAATQRHWSPEFVPSRPATAIGVPGILGEGIYKVSRISALSSGRPRQRRTPTILKHQGPRLYTVSKHFDKTLSRGDIVQASTGRYLARRASLGLARAPTHDPNRTDIHATSDQIGATAVQSQPGTLSVLHAVPTSTRYLLKPRRLHTINDTPSSELSPGFDESGYQIARTGPAEGATGPPFSQPAPYRSEGFVDDVSITSSSQTLVGLPTQLEMADDWLLRISQIQHEGLCEASMIWDEFAKRAADEIKSTERSGPGLGSGAVPEILAEYETEFARRWDAVLAVTAQKMRDARAGGFAF
ncbi:hypothetical protein VTK26DRAFT_6191 [Humicola hyalothermophila]